MRHHGRYPEPRRRLTSSFTQALIAASLEDGQPLRLHRIAADCGFSHAQALSNQLHDPAGITPSQRPKFERIARLIRFPVGQIFVDPAPPPPQRNAEEARP